MFSNMAMAQHTRSTATFRRASLLPLQIPKRCQNLPGGPGWGAGMGWPSAQVWILEMIGKGVAEKGAVWVAIRIPDGHVSGHANQARIQRFPLHDENCVYSSDAGSPIQWSKSDSPL